MGPSISIMGCGNEFYGPGYCVALFKSKAGPSCVMTVLTLRLRWRRGEGVARLGYPLPTIQATVTASSLVKSSTIYIIVR